MSTAPSSSPGRPATSIPSRATTPPKPRSSPTSRSPAGRSAGDSRVEISATISGMLEIRMAASDEATCCSPVAMSTNGSATSQAAYARTAGQWPLSPRSEPRRQAAGSSSIAPRATRDQATNPGGTPASTATLMKKYGTPQTTETAPNSSQARALTGALSGPPTSRMRPPCSSVFGRLTAQPLDVALGRALHHRLGVPAQHRLPPAAVDAVEPVGPHRLDHPPDVPLGQGQPVGGAAHEGDPILARGDEDGVAAQQHPGPAGPLGPVHDREI